MSPPAELLAHFRDLFAPLGPVRSRAMFGGAGLFLGNAMFALVAGDQLWMKADADLAERYRAAGSAPFTYARSGRPAVIMSFWRLPEEALDDPDQALAWARASLPVAEAAADRRRR